MRSYRRGANLGNRVSISYINQAKLNTCSSTISEIVAVDDMMAQIMWTWLFMKAQCIKVTDNILYQYNKSVIPLEKNGRASSFKRTKHIEVWYYYVAN